MAEPVVQSAATVYQVQLADVSRPRRPPLLKTLPQHPLPGSRRRYRRWTQSRPLGLLQLRRVSTGQPTPPQRRNSTPVFHRQPLPPQQRLLRRPRCRSPPLPLRRPRHLPQCRAPPRRRSRARPIHLRSSRPQQLPRERTIWLCCPRPPAIPPRQLRPDRCSRGWPIRIPPICRRGTQSAPGSTSPQCRRLPATSYRPVPLPVVNSSPAPASAQSQPHDARSDPAALPFYTAPAAISAAPANAPVAQMSGLSAAPQPGTATQQVAMHVAQSLIDGGKTVTVELHPAELGRVESFLIPFRRHERAFDSRSPGDLRRLFPRPQRSGATTDAGRRGSGLRRVRPASRAAAVRRGRKLLQWKDSARNNADNAIGVRSVDVVGKQQFARYPGLNQQHKDLP